jgi:hypothetical protein
MEEYIYIIIGVIWVAASIYKASQRKKEKAISRKPATAVPEEEAKHRSTRSLLEELLEGQKLRPPEPEVIELDYDEPMFAEIEELPKQGSFQSEYAGFSLKELEAISGEGVSSLGRISFVDIMKESEKKDARPVKIDLRKAIIYSAILERPYT